MSAIFRRHKFCCCFPVRIGVFVLSGLSILFSGVLAVACWYEVSRGSSLVTSTRNAFIGAGVVSTFLFLVSVAGFIGAATRKQVLVAIYSIFLWIHLILNTVIAGWLLWHVYHASSEDIQAACDSSSVNGNSSFGGQCKDLLNGAKWVYVVSAVVSLLIEAYAALIVARYLHQLRHEKRDLRRKWMDAGSTAFGLLPETRDNPNSHNKTDSFDLDEDPQHVYQPVDGHVAPKAEEHAEAGRGTVYDVPAYEPPAYPYAQPSNSFGTASRA